MEDSFRRTNYWKDFADWNTGTHSNIELIYYLLAVGNEAAAGAVKDAEDNGCLKNLPIGNEQAGRKINHYFSRRSSMVLSVEACHGEKAGKRNVFYRAG